MWVWSLGQEDPLEEDMATHSNILAWRIPWAQEPGGLQSIGLQRVTHNWSNLALTWCRNRKGLPTEGCLLYSVPSLGCRLKGWVQFFKNHHSEYMTYPLSCIDKLNFSVSLHMWGSYKFTWYMCKHAQLCLTLCSTMDCSLPALLHGIFQGRILGWVAFFYSRGPSQPRDQTYISCASCIGRWIVLSLSYLRSLPGT